MKKITLEEAVEILLDASAVVINDQAIIYPHVEDLTGDDDNEFLYLGWDEEGLGFRLIFCEEGNREVKVVGSSMFLYDIDAEDEKDHTQITILTTKNLE